LSGWLSAHQHVTQSNLIRLFRSFNANAAPFRKESETRETEIKAGEAP
jgi:hypothetical protein